MISLWQSRQWITIGRSWSWASARCRSNHVLLFGERGAVPVPVEAGFSDGDDTWASDHIQDEGPILLADFGRLVGVDADGGEDSAVCCCASSSDPALEAAVVPMAMIWDTPSLAARSRMPGRSARSRRSSRWAWVSTSGPGVGTWGQGIHRWAAPGAARADLSGFPVADGPGRNPFKAIAFPFLGCLTVSVNVVLNSNPGPGLENSFVGLGPSGAWLAPCAQIVVYLSGRVVPRRCCSYWRTEVGGPSPVLRGGVPAACACTISVRSCDWQAGAEWL